MLVLLKKVSLKNTLLQVYDSFC